ncbi:MAG: poly(A) polymerase, partial [Planctomycetota bacterium]
MHEPFQEDGTTDDQSPAPNHSEHTQSKGKKARARKPEFDLIEPSGDVEPETVDSSDIPNHRIHEDALRVVSRLMRSGHESYLVGGCVRDLLLGRKPKDFDIATAAHPRQIRRLFRNARIIGRRFKLAHIYYGDHILETATFRAPPEADGEDLLITDDNAFGTAAEDAMRRDFKINGLFLDPVNNLIHDFVGGLDDLEDRILSTIGDPRVRMAEDPVRIMRAIKFATRLGFDIEDDTWDAMCEFSVELERSAPPRILEELMRLCLSGTALGAFRMMRACGALGVLLPGIDQYIGAASDPDPDSHDRADSYWRLLEALDADVHANREPSRALCLAVLWLRVIEREADPETRTLRGEPGDMFDVVSEVLDPLVQDSRLPRRIFIIARRMIVDQARFDELPGSDPRALVFTTTEGFPEALNLFRIRSAAWGQGWDVYEAWRTVSDEVADLPSDELDAL